LFRDAHAERCAPTSTYVVGPIDGQELSVWRTTGRIASASVFGIALGVIGSPLAGAQQPLTRTDLLKLDIGEVKNGEMNVWVADIPPGAATGRHSHPTPRFVYVIEGAVVVELDGKPPQTFKTGQAFAEMPDQIHNFRNASSTESAKALGFQYARKDQPLQTNAP
jgi:quercetin dioxygenase-like cupin family protein